MSKVWLQKVCQKCDHDGTTLVETGNRIFPKKIVNALTVDHIHELTDGGRRGYPNHQLLCKACHKTKSKIFTLRRNELERKLTAQESEELNKAFLEGRYQFKKIDGKKRVMIKG